MTIVVRDDGKKMWAYKGKPLYTFKKDTAPGETNGDGFLNGAWHMASVGSKGSRSAVTNPARWPGWHFRLRRCGGARLLNCATLRVVPRRPLNCRAPVATNEAAPSRSDACPSFI